jgi:hypothetical protein
MTLKKRVNTVFSNFKYKLLKRGVTSGGSRLSYHFKRFLPIEIKVARHRYRLLGNAKSSLGRRILRTRKSYKPTRVGYLINYGFRLRLLTFTASIQILPYSHKLISLVFLSNGGSTYLPTSYSHILFKLTRVYRSNLNLGKFRTKLDLMNPYFYIQHNYVLIRNLPRNRPVSLLEPVPGYGILYTRSPGTSSSITKMDFRTNTALVRLSSGVRKVFSVFSLGSLGPNPLSDNRYWRSNKAGYYSNFGRKSTVRGVAMNPIDHPHGGRTKSIKYPRTPWGKTTKFK